IRTSKRIYGQYFYNVNSTYTMWCDSWPEAKAFLETRRHRTQWREFPPDQVPSPAKYWREHSVSKIANRLIGGLRTLATRSFKLTGYYKYLLVFFVVGTVLAAQRSQVLGRFIKEKPFAVCFCFLFFLSYVLLYAWYDAIVSDSRFVLSLFLPFVFVASKLILEFGKDCTWGIAGRRWPFMELFATVLIGLSLIDLFYNAVRISEGW